MNFYYITCLDCGVNCDLLTDRNHRIICRDCLEKWEIAKEVESQLEDYNDEEIKSAEEYQKQFEVKNEKEK